MESVLEILASHPGLWAFVLLLLCGFGLPPWSEEIVLLGTGYFVATGDLSFWGALGWCYAGILLGDSFIWWMGKFAGERVYQWPFLRRKFQPARRVRFQKIFFAHGAKAVFAARFLPGIRLMAYFIAGNLGMPLWKFALLDSLGALLTVPASVFIGRLFAENLDYALALIHKFEIPLIILGIVVGWWLLRKWGTAQAKKLSQIRQQRAERALSKKEDS